MAWGAFFKSKLTAYLGSTTAQASKLIGFSSSLLADLGSIAAKALGKQSFSLDFALSLLPPCIMVASMVTGCVKPCGRSNVAHKKMGATLLLCFLYVAGRSALNTTLACHTDYSDAERLEKLELAVNMAEVSLEMAYLLIVSCPRLLEKFCEKMCLTAEIEEEDAESERLLHDSNNYGAADEIRREDLSGSMA